MSGDADLFSKAANAVEGMSAYGAVDIVEKIVEIKWHYTPPQYFEEQLILEWENYSIKISDGYISAKMTADVFNSQPNLIDVLTQKLNDYFIGAQPILKQGFKIQANGVDRIQPDGRRDVTVLAEPLELKVTVYNADLVYTDKEGVAHNTRRDRIDATNNLAMLSVRHAATDLTARLILNSFDAAVRDPGNELVHLYEIWDALTKRFGKEQNAKRALGISNYDRRRLGELANHLPLNQGRHRGQHAGSLRDATIEELDEARVIAQNMLTSYLQYLDDQ